jgi:hypothetical protein
MIKGRQSGFIQCHYFAVQDRAFNFDCFSDRGAKLLESFHFVSFAGDESTPPIFDIG